MKSMILSALMMSAMALSAAAAGTQDYCTAGTRILNDRVISMEDDFTNYRGLGCVTDPSVQVTLDATLAPNGFGVTGTFTDGTIGTGGALVIKGPGHDRVGNSAPVLIRIERNIFEPDAVMLVSGSFPTSSLISISQNTFDVGVRHDLLLGINNNFIAAITLGHPDTETLLYTNAQFTIYENKINVADRSGATDPFITYGIYQSSHLYMSGESGFLVQRNNITGTAAAKSIGLYCPRNAYMMGNNTLVQITSNNIELTNGIMFHSPGISVTDEFVANADFSHNTATLTPVEGQGHAMIVGPMNLTSTSEVEIASNTIVSIQPASMLTASTRIFVNGPAHIRGSSALSIWFNTMNTKGGSPQINFGGPATVESSGRLWIVGNEMVRQEGLTLGLSPVTFFQLNMRDQGAVAISQNVFGSDNPNSKPLMISLYSSGTATRTGNATLDVCHNTWFGAPFPDNASLQAAIHASIRASVTDLGMCPDVITTTTSTVPPPTTTYPVGVYTTTAPQNNGAPGAASCVVTVAAVAVAIAALLA